MNKLKKHSVIWPFTVWINCSSDLKVFWSLEQFFLTVGQNNFVNKVPNVLIFLHRRGHDVFVAMPFCKDKSELNYTIICSDPDENIMPMIDSITEPILKVIYFQIIDNY